MVCSIASNQWFAQSAPSDFDSLLLGYGSDDRSKQVLVKPSQVVSSFFNVTTRLDDIAFVYAPNIGRDILSAPLKVAIGNLTSHGLNQSSKLTLVGWGSTKHAKDKVVPEQLQSTTMGYYDLELCRKQLIPKNNLHYRDVNISEQSNFCLLNHHSTACYVNLVLYCIEQSNRNIVFFYREIPAVLSIRWRTTILFFCTDSCLGEIAHAH